MTTYLSWRVGFLLELIVIAIVLSQISLVKDIPYTGDRRVDVVGAILSVLGMGGVVLGILVWQEGGDYVVLLIALGALALGAFAAGSCDGTVRARSRYSTRTCSDFPTSGSGSPGKRFRT